MTFTNVLSAMNIDLRKLYFEKEFLPIRWIGRPVSYTHLILRAIEELTFKSITYKSASGKSYDFNTADKMNCLLVKCPACYWSIEIRSRV